MRIQGLTANPQPIGVDDIVQALFHLPVEQLVQVYDFILFLQGRYGQPVDESDSWSDEDLYQLNEASLHYAAATNLIDEQE